MADSALAAPVAGADSFGIEDLLGSASAIDRRLPATLFPSLAGDTCERAELSLRELAAQIERTSASAKDRLPLLKLATFGAVKTAKGSLRHTDNIERVHGIEGDHDAGTLSLADARSKLSAAGVAGLIYSTPSHTPRKARAGASWCLYRSPWHPPSAKPLPLRLTACSMARSHLRAS